MSDTTTTRPRPDGGLDALRDRPLVPTPRQREVGDVSEDPPAVVGVPPVHGERSWRDAVRAWAAAADPRAVRGPRLPLLVLGLSSLLATWDDAALGIIAPELRAEFGVSIGFLATLSSAVAIAGTALALPFGYLADRVTRVWIVRVGSIVTNAASIGQGLAPGLGTLVGARFAAGLGLAATEPASFALMTDYYASRYRSRVFSFLYAAAQVGAVLGPLVAGFLVLRYGWRAGVVSLGVLATVVAVLTFFLWEPVRGRHERQEAGAAPEEADQEQDPVGFAEAWRAAASITTLRRIWFARPLLFLKGFATVGLFSLYFGEVWVLSPGQRGAIFSLHAVVTLVGLVTLAPAADRLLQRTPGRFLTLAGAILVVQAGGFVVMGFAPDVTTAIVASVPIATIDAMLAPAFFALISQVVPPRIRGLGLQTIKPWDLLGIVAFPFVASLLDGGLGLHRGMALFALPMLAAAAILGSAAPGVERDIRAAKAAAMADQAARRARAAGRAAVLTVRDLHVGYDGVDVLFGIDLDVHQGEFVALVGTNGAGKSTLLRAVAGLQPASGGAVFLDTRDTTYLPAARIAALGVTMVPGGRAVFPDLTVEQNLATAAWLVPPDDVEARLAEVLDRLPELRDLLGRRAGTLSGGEQQMVALGQAFVTRPRVLLVDELSLGLAPAVVDRLLRVLRDLHAAGATIVVVEQSLNVASSVAERAVFMEKGEVRFDGPMAQLVARPDLVRSVFLGGGLGGPPARTGPTARRSPIEDRRPAIEVTDAAVRFGGVPALEGVGLSVRPGEVLGIIGPNGAGKTTLFDLISGFVAPDRGRVVLAGVDVTDQPTHARARAGLGRSFQTARLFGSLSVRETVAAFLDRRDGSSPLSAALWLPAARSRERAVLARADDLLELVGLTEMADRFVSELSTGSRRLVDVACTMAQRPRVLLLDEPSSGLAQAETEALGPLLRRLVRETDCAMLLIEHDLPLVTRVADRVLALELGRRLTTGPPDAVLRDPEVLRAYLTASEDVVRRSGSRLDAITAALTSPDRHPNRPERE